MPASSHQVTLPSFKSLASTWISACPAHRWAFGPSWKLPAGSPIVSLTRQCSWFGQNPLPAIHVHPQHPPPFALLSLLNSRLLHSSQSAIYLRPISLLSLPVCWMSGLALLSEISIPHNSARGIVAPPYRGVRCGHLRGTSAAEWGTWVQSFWAQPPGPGSSYCSAWLVPLLCVLAMKSHPPPKTVRQPKCGDGVEVWEVFSPPHWGAHSGSTWGHICLLGS